MSHRERKCSAHHSARNGRLFRNRRIAPTPPAPGPVLVPSPVILLLGDTRVGTDTASRTRLAAGPTLPAAPDQSNYAVRVPTSSARVGSAMSPGLRGEVCTSRPVSEKTSSRNCLGISWMALGRAFWLPRSSDKCALRPLLLIRGSLEWSPVGFSKQFLQAVR